jgi:hypothetical protein
VEEFVPWGEGADSQEVAKLVLKGGGASWFQVHRTRIMFPGVEDLVLRDGRYGSREGWVFRDLSWSTRSCFPWVN